MSCRRQKGNAMASGGRRYIGNEGCKGAMNMIGYTSSLGTSGCISIFVGHV